MARSGAKRGPPRSSPPSAPTSTTQQPPKPFTRVPVTFGPFLDSLEKDGHFYVTHIDRTPRAEKRQLFMAPAILNTVFALLILIRIYYAVPSYISLFSALIGLDSDARVETSETPTGDLVAIVMSRFGLLVLDYSLYKLPVQWVLRFLREETSWRWSIGYNDEEVVVRISKKWHTGLWTKWTAEDERKIADRILPALDKQRIRKNALQLVDAWFLLDCTAMVKAHDLVNNADLTLSNFDQKVFVYYKPMKEWIVWDLAEPIAITKKDSGNLAQLRDNLIKRGKEDLFFRYVEIVQYESSRPGGFLVGYQQKVIAELKKAFDEQGVSFGIVMREMGGEENMPFFENAPQDHL